jgi:propanol-preferring alcohol dehydrogenase
VPAAVNHGFRAWRLEHPDPDTDDGPLVRSDGPRPSAGAGEVLLAVHACAVCRTDLQLAEGDLPARHLPIVPGHQVVGTVVGLGPGVTGHVVGDRVGVAWIGGTCGHCRFCTSGRENLCEEATFTGWDRDGGYATHMTARADFVHRLPDGFDDLDAAPLLCGGVIGYRALRVAGMGPDRAGARLGLYGFGASATCVIQVALHCGIDVYVCTRSETEQQAALALGAAWAGGYDEAPPAPLDAAITFAPAGAVVAVALKALDRGGVVAVNAIHLDHLPEMPYDDLWWERSIRSVANVTRDDVREFLDLAASIPVRTRTEVLPLDEAGTALRRLAAGDVAGSFVLRVD